MGGSTGQWLGIHAPERFSHIVLANTAAKIGGTDGWNTRIATVLRDGMGVMVEPSVQRWFTSGFVALGMLFVASVVPRAGDLQWRQTFAA